MEPPPDLGRSLPGPKPAVTVLWAIPTPDHACLHARPRLGTHGPAGMSPRRSLSNTVVCRGETGSERGGKTGVLTPVHSHQLTRFLAWAQAGGVSGAYTTLLLQEEETVPNSHPGLSGEGAYFCLPQL